MKLGAALFDPDLLRYRTRNGWHASQHVYSIGRTNHGFEKKEIQKLGDRYRASLTLFRLRHTVLFI